MRGLAHAHEHHAPHRTPRPRQRHLGDDLGAAELAQQPVAAGHAEDTAHGAAHLRGHANAIAGQQHALHRLAIRQRHQQAHRAVFTGVLRLHPRETGELRLQARQIRQQPRRECRLRARGEGARLAAVGPGPQGERFVPRPGTGGA